MSLLLRRAVHARVPDTHRRSGIYQKDRERKSHRFGSCDLRREPDRCDLRASLSVEVLCEGACVEKTLLQKPIEIGRLQRYATDHVLTNGKQIFEKGEPIGKSVGVVGSGPAGLSCAAYLSRLGYDVTVYDQKEKPGGLDTYGMAEYKMPQAVSLAETERIAAMGVKFMLNTRIVAPGPGEPEVLGEMNRVSFDLLDQWHDAIFLGVGLGDTNKLGIPGEILTEFTTHSISSNE
jgi:glutamate synthase (NADPH/NADH) small chain